MLLLAAREFFKLLAYMHDQGNTGSFMWGGQQKKRKFSFILKKDIKFHLVLSKGLTPNVTIDCLICLPFICLSYCFEVNCSSTTVVK
jgi:hypothetical protein